MANQTGSIKSRESYAGPLPAFHYADGDHCLTPYGQAERSRQRADQSRREFGSLILDCPDRNITSDDLEVLHGDNHDGQPEPTDTYSWSMSDDDYRSLRKQAEMDAEAEFYEKERAIELHNRQMGGWEAICAA